MIDAVKESDRRDAQYTQHRSEKRFEPTIVNKPKLEVATHNVQTKSVPQQTSKPTTSNDFQCFNCDQRGHSQKSCPFPKNQKKLRLAFDNLKISHGIQPNTQVSNPRPQVPPPARKEERRPQTSNYRGEKRGRGNTTNNYRDDETIEPPRKRPSPDPQVSPEVLHETQVLKTEEMANRNMAYTIESTNQSGIIKALLNNRDSPIFPILINGRKVRALFDTGGVITLVSEQLSKFLNLKLTPWTYTQIQGVTGSVVPKGIATEVTIAFRD